MDFSKTGIILYTEKYQECVSFYGEVLELTLLFEIDRPGEKLTCFGLGGAYLMIETGGQSHSGVKPIDICPTKFRFNVEDVDTVSADLRSKGVSIEVSHYEWGATAEFADPDGNSCALRSNEGFGV
jgi:lactoylglutathione lyase